MTEQTKSEKEFYREWAGLINKYLSFLTGVSVTLDAVKDAKSLEEIRRFDKSLSELKAKYPESFR